MRRWRGPATRLLQIVLTIALPVVFVTGTIRAALATDALLRWEYFRPGFTPDGYRFQPLGPLWTTEERLRYGTATLEWLRDGRPLAELAAVRQDSGVPLYTQNELLHMDDVQRLTNLLSRVLFVAAVAAVVGIWLLALRRDTRPALATALFHAGVGTWATFGLLALLLLGGVGSGSWTTLFVGFHQVFFPQGNWQFYYSDSLIRLFPEQLWFDVAAILIGTPLALAALSAVVGLRLRRSRSKVQG